MRKCVFMAEHVLFLGFLVGKDYVRMDLEKTIDLENMHAPTNITESRSFMGLASFYRKFIKNFGSVIVP